MLPYLKPIVEKRHKENRSSEIKSSVTQLPRSSVATKLFNNWKVLHSLCIFFSYLFFFKHEWFTLKISSVFWKLLGVSDKWCDLFVFSPYSEKVNQVEAWSSIRGLCHPFLREKCPKARWNKASIQSNQQRTVTSLVIRLNL